MTSDTLLFEKDLAFCAPYMQSHAYKYRLTFILNKNTGVAAKVRPTRMKVDKVRQPRRVCKVDGCANYIANQGRCCRHGGGKKCSIQGCNTSAKRLGLCWKHGGSVECQVPECTKRAKSRGLCWGHGGGTRCHETWCQKVAVSNGFCWAHGGGKRCNHEGCHRPAYERTSNLCHRHFANP